MAKVLTKNSSLVLKVVISILNWSRKDLTPDQVRKANTFLSS